MYRKLSFRVPWDISGLNVDGSLSDRIFIWKFKREAIKQKCGHLMTHPGLLMGSGNIQTTNSPW